MTEMANGRDMGQMAVADGRKEPKKTIIFGCTM